LSFIINIFSGKSGREAQGITNFKNSEDIMIEELGQIEYQQFEQLTHFLQTQDLSPFCQSNAIRSEYLFGGSTFVCMPNWIFCGNRHQSNDYDDDFKYFCSLIAPLVESMKKLLEDNTKKEHWFPRNFEINILPAGVKIRPHQDQHTGVGTDVRVHLVLYTNENVIFKVGGNSYYFSPGTCFRFDNKKVHSVENNHPTLPRAHMVVDFSPTHEVE
jgi:hypothetical protein